MRFPAQLHGGDQNHLQAPLQGLRTHLPFTLQAGVDRVEDRCGCGLSAGQHVCLVAAHSVVNPGLGGRRGTYCEGASNPPAFPPLLHDGVGVGPSRLPPPSLPSPPHFLHASQVVDLDELAHLNTCFKHFLFFTMVSELLSIGHGSRGCIDGCKPISLLSLAYGCVSAAY